MLEKSRTYHETHGTNYWTDLTRMEKQGERHIATMNGVEWLTPFAPLRGINEIQAIVNNQSNLLELTHENWTGLAQGISRTLKFYDTQGYTSFNIILVSGPLDKHLDYFDVNLRIMSRPGIQTMSFTDAGHSHTTCGTAKHRRTRKTRSKNQKRILNA
jgi:galactose-1-phosphate uridylyltransferase